MECPDCSNKRVGYAMTHVIDRIWVCLWCHLIIIKREEA